MRQILEISGGEYRAAPGGRGAWLTGNSDWLLATGTANLTANGTANGFDDHYFHTNPRFETSDPNYAWLQQVLSVGQGRIIEGLGVQYKAFQVTEVE
jgi:hypothetical protein